MPQPSRRKPDAIEPTCKCIRLYAEIARGPTNRATGNRSRDHALERLLLGKDLRTLLADDLLYDPSFNAAVLEFGKGVFR